MIERTMRVVTSLSALLIAASMGCGDVAAQAIRPGGPSFPLVPTSVQINAGAGDAPSWHNRVLTALGSAALGAGAAYFASQINESDWEEIPGQRESNRALWAAVGGGVGFAMGFSFPLHGRAPGERGLVTRPEGRSVISFYEINEASVDNAYDIIRLLRPDWLNTRPPDELFETEAESTTVYLDDFRYGDIDELYGIHVSTIESIRFISPAMATARWGPGNVMGVIQIITVG